MYYSHWLECVKDEMLISNPQTDYSTITQLAFRKDVSLVELYRRMWYPEEVAKYLTDD